MAAVSLMMQQDIDRTLRRAEADIRDFVALLKQPCSGRKEVKRAKELQELGAKLQEHRAQVRRWVGLVEPRHESRAKLGAVRGRIEQELRRFREQQSAAKDPQPPSGKSAGPVASTAPAAPGAARPGCGPVPSSEVKVLSDQLFEVEASSAQITEEFVCKICLVHLVGCVPRLTRCSHLFCGDCLAQWFAMQPATQTWAGRAQGAASVPCPACKEPLDQDRDVFPILPGGRGCSSLLWQMLSRTKIMCANHPSCDPEGTCMWQGDYGSYQAHIRSCCKPQLPSSPSGTPQRHGRAGGFQTPIGAGAHSL
uniref:RING-type domain-containing protein n=1 Tax=Alexandrium catenella TaxID=2925 RepID=A0A7S1W6N2_ALECA